MFKQNVPLKDYSRYQIGGLAAYFLEISTKDDLLKGLKEWRKVSVAFPQEEKKIFILGGGTNILFSDEGFNGLVLKNSIDSIESKENKVTAGAGTLVVSLLDFCIENSLSGLEWAGGLPGTIGGAVRGNAGAFGGETKDSVLEVVSIDLETFQEIKRSKEECEFSYRTSIFKTRAKNELIVSATFEFTKGNKEDIRSKILEKTEFRKIKLPLDYPNAGSIFKNVPFSLVPEQYKKELSQYVKNDPFPVVPTAKIIFLARLKDKKVGDAMVSDKHTNFIVNLGNAKASEVKALIKIIKSAVRQKYQIELEEEIIYP
ncbi:MAG TPA: UDP-N-acetylmuramate dehydrogenase [Patescibacteria group bacterium]|jgi:UDP-N-acetylmuramate dehydrogenase|nr:UDP-N-acetylmuramate dehydrogenase [Patescibacteria group bacterium]